MAGFSGLIAPVAMVLSLWLAIDRAPWFSWKDNYLSDLGVAEGSELLFNGGLIVSGIMFLLLIKGIKEYMPARPTITRALYTLAAGAIALICIGVFDEDAGSIHFIVAVIFFVLSAIGLVMLGIGEQKHVSKKRGAICLALGAILAVAWIIPWPGTGGALPEIVGTICLMAMSVLYGATLILSVCPFSTK